MRGQAALATAGKVPALRKATSAGSARFSFRAGIPVLRSRAPAGVFNSDHGFSNVDSGARAERLRYSRQDASATLRTYQSYYPTTFLCKESIL